MYACYRMDHFQYSVNTARQLYNTHLNYLHKDNQLFLESLCHESFFEFCEESNVNGLSPGKNLYIHEPFIHKRQLDRCRVTHYYNHINYELKERYGCGTDCRSLVKWYIYKLGFFWIVWVHPNRFTWYSKNHLLWINVARSLFVSIYLDLNRDMNLFLTWMDSCGFTEYLLNLNRKRLQFKENYLDVLGSYHSHYYMQTMEYDIPNSNTCTHFNGFTDRLGVIPIREPNIPEEYSKIKRVLDELCRYQNITIVRKLRLHDSNRNDGDFIPFEYREKWIRSTLDLDALLSVSSGAVKIYKYTVHLLEIEFKETMFCRDINMLRLYLERSIIKHVTQHFM